jgi:hypothetical protein
MTFIAADAANDIVLLKGDGCFQPLAISGAIF